MSKPLSKKLLRYGEGKSGAELTKMMFTACKCPRSRIVEALARLLLSHHTHTISSRTSPIISRDDYQSLFLSLSLSPAFVVWCLTIIAVYDAIINEHFSLTNFT